MVNDPQRAKLMKNVSHVFRKNSLCPVIASMEELLGEHNFYIVDCKTVRAELESYFDSTKKNKFEAKD